MLFAFIYLATTKALHLEITQDVSANSVILALPRFTARRNPRLFISDNFKSFNYLEVKKFYVNYESNGPLFLRNLHGGEDFMNDLSPS